MRFFALVAAAAAFSVQQSESFVNEYDTFAQEDDE